MIVNCPVCGPRESTEFSYIGQGISEKDREQWRHTFGCASILAVRRDLSTDRVLAVKAFR